MALRFDIKVNLAGTDKLARIRNRRHTGLSCGRVDVQGRSRAGRDGEVEMGDRGLEKCRKWR